MSLRPPSPILSAGIALVASAALAPHKACALEWSAEPMVSLQQIYNDNIRLTTAAHESVTGTLLIPKLTLSVRSENWGLNGAAQLRHSNYSGTEGLDSNDQTYTLASNFNTLRSRWQLSGSSTKESILTGDFIDGDTGLVRTQVERSAKSATPSWAFSLTETTKVSVDYQYTDVIYDQGLAVGLFDYQQSQTSLTLSSLLSERTQVFVTASYSEFDVTATQFHSQNNVAQAGVDYRLTETMKLALSGGPRRTTSQGIVKVCTIPTIFGCAGFTDTNVTSETRGAVYNAALENQFENTRLKFNLSRNTSPSGTGAQVETDSLGVTSQTALDPRNSLLFSATAYRARSDEDELSSTDRRYYLAEPKWRWRCSLHCTVDLSYRYTYLKYINQDIPAKSNSVSLVLAYQWPKMWISR
jgi:hypothetical protein